MNVQVQYLEVLFLKNIKVNLQTTCTYLHSFPDAVRCFNFPYARSSETLYFGLHILFCLICLLLHIDHFRFADAKTFRSFNCSSSLLIAIGGLDVFNHTESFPTLIASASIIAPFVLKWFQLRSKVSNVVLSEIASLNNLAPSSSNLLFPRSRALRSLLFCNTRYEYLAKMTVIYRIE